MAGAAWSSVLAAALPCLILGSALARRRRALRTLATPDLALLARIVRFALPNAANSFAGAATFFFFVWATGRIGPLALAVSNICFCVNCFYFTLTSGLGNGLSALVGRFRGARGKIIGTARVYRLSSDNGDNTLRYGQVRKVSEFVEKHYAEDIRLEQMISISGMSKNTFIRVFSDIFNMTPWHYLTTIRLNAVRKLLETTDKLLVDIAAETGFFDQSHLTRVFKKERGMTPGEYRRRHRQ